MAPSPDTNTASLLVVDDDRVTQARRNAYVSQEGYRVLLAGDGETFWQQLEHAAVDLVLLDLELRDSRGLATFERLLKSTGERDALIAMEGKLKGHDLVAAAFDFAYMGGSMGSVVGERFTLAAERALELRCPYVCFSSSGGARMQESLFSLMQMAKTSAALGRLRAAGVHLLNQAVLLRGVNDSVDALGALSERGFAAGVLPYYLHQLDRVAGVAHFEVDDAHARALHAGLAARLSGYLVPRLVREIPGDTGKRPL